MLLSQTLYYFDCYWYKTVVVGWKISLASQLPLLSVPAVMSGTLLTVNNFSRKFGDEPVTDIIYLECVTQAISS